MYVIVLCFQDSPIDTALRTVNSLSTVVLLELRLEVSVGKLEGELIEEEA